MPITKKAVNQIYKARVIMNNKEQFAPMAAAFAYRSDLTAREFRVYIFIASKCGLSNQKIGWCWYSHKQIADETGIARPHVSAAIKSLLDKGMLVEDTDTRRAKNHRVNSYAIVAPESWVPMVPQTVRSMVPQTVRSNAVQDPVYGTADGTTDAVYGTADGTTDGTADGTTAKYLNRKENKKRSLLEKKIPRIEIFEDKKSDCADQEKSDFKHAADTAYDIHFFDDDFYPFDYENDISNSNAIAVKDDTYSIKEKSADPRSLQNCPTKAVNAVYVANVQDSRLPALKKANNTQIRQSAAIDPDALASVPKKSGRKYKYDDEHMTVARQWAQYANQECPTLRINLEQWADESRRWHEIDKMHPQKQLELLNFIIKDDFWSKNAISLLGLRKQGKNGLRKFENIRSSMLRSPQYLEAKVIEDVLSGNVSDDMNAFFNDEYGF